MPDKTDVWQGTLSMMVPGTLETEGPLHGYGIARRIEQISGNALSVNYGTIHPALIRLRHEGFVAAEWGVSENNRMAKYYSITRTGRKQLKNEIRQWRQMIAIVARFFSPNERD
jgi:transcriptional regulator